MALTTTTLNGAIGVDDVSLRVTSGTGFGKGKYILLDDEKLLQSADADAASPTIIPVIRGVNGSVAAAHVTSANVTVGTGAEFTGEAVTTPLGYPLAGRERRKRSYSASGAITLPSPGTDMVAILNGTGALAMTVAAPTKDMDDSLLFVVANGAAAHTVQFTGGLSLAGGSYDILTSNASAPVLYMVMACNGAWIAPVAVAMTGTVTNVTAGLA